MDPKGGETGGGSRLRTLLAWRPPSWLTAPLALVLVGVAGWYIVNELRAHSVADIWRAAAEQPRPIFLAAAGLVALSFVALIIDEWLALRLMQAPRKLLAMALPALATYTLANALSFSFATAPAVRARLYRDMLSPVEIATLSAVTGASVFVGATTTLGASLFVAAREIAGHGLGAPLLWRVLGVLLLAPAVIWMGAALGPRRVITALGVKLSSPSLLRGMAQLVVAVIGWAAAAGVLYALLPGHGGWSFCAFAGLFVAVSYLGAASGAPAGLGVFDAAILTLAAGTGDIAAAAGAVLVYRMLYTVAPLTLGMLIMGADLIETRRRPSS